MILHGAARYPVREIILHFSAIQPERMGNAPLSAKLAEIRRWHMRDRGWRNIGYHWLIDFDGQRAAGRPEIDIGAHVVDHNQGTIGVCLIGGHGADADNKFAEHFISAQARTVRGLIAGIRSRTQLATVTGHNTYAAKSCPGVRVAGWIWVRPPLLTLPWIHPKPGALCSRERRTCALKGDWDARAGPNRLSLA
jgi:hypothetical protein